MTQIIPFPKKPEPAAEVLSESEQQAVILVANQHMAHLASRALSSASCAVLDLSLCVQGWHDSQSAHVSEETVTSLVEALRLSILATGCRNQDRALITALCAWSESTKEPMQ